MAVETKLFLHKVEEMSKLVSAMKLWMPSHESELQDIESGLSNLSNFVEKDNCLNAGGKFEWVDSVLVKVFHQMARFSYRWKTTSPLPAFANISCARRQIYERRRIF